MDLRFAAFAIALIVSRGTFAQQSDPAEIADNQERPEEFVITGERATWNLRIQMIEAEKQAYDLFNAFNDEARFNISCDMHQPTGTRFASQVCEPEFERRAKAAHAESSFKNMQDMLNQFAAGATQPIDIYPPMHIPPEAVIASQQEAYRAKMRQVATEHPEFLDAVIRFGELRQAYERASTGNETGD